MTRKVHVGVAQTYFDPKDIEGNLERIHTQIKSAAPVGVEALVFSEVCIQPLMQNNPEAVYEAPGGPISTKLSGWAKEYNMIVMACMPEKCDQGLYVSYYVLKPDGDMFTVRKYLGEKSHELFGRLSGPIKRAPFFINGVKCAVLICSECGVKAIQDDVKEQGIELIFAGFGGGVGAHDCLTEADMATAEGKLKYIGDCSRWYIPHPIYPQHIDWFGTAAAYTNAIGEIAGGGGYFTGHCQIVDKNLVMRAQIAGTNVIDHFTDQMVHAVLQF